MRWIYKLIKTDTFGICLANKPNPTWQLFRIFGIYLENKLTLTNQRFVAYWNLLGKETWGIILDKNRLLELIIIGENEWIEFKEKNTDHEKIGRYISALANSSALLGRQDSYMVWGIDDSTREIVGTDFDPYSEKKGGEPFISWLERMLDPRIDIRFETCEADGLKVVVLIIQMTVGRPVSFRGERYIRSGSSLKNLSEYPEKERNLWKSFEARAFELEFAKTGIDKDTVFRYLDVDTYARMMNLPDSLDENILLNEMIEDNIIERSGNAYNITNMGAFTFAKHLRDFPSLQSHAIRVIKYRGTQKLQATVDQTAAKGVGTGFKGLLNFIKAHLPAEPEELNDSGQMVLNTDYPDLVVREIVANQIVHQDFSVTGSSPMIEIYDNRVVFTNPGSPIHQPDRLLDMHPISRNEHLANLFRKMKLVESRGSGIDKIVATLEVNGLPAPDISVRGNYTVVTLFQRKTLKDMTDREKVNALYYHAAFHYIEDKYINNKSVRERFGLNDKQSASASKLISLAISNNKIKVYNKNAGNKNMQYIPYWGTSYTEE